MTTIIEVTESTTVIEALESGSIIIEIPAEQGIQGIQGISGGEVTVIAGSTLSALRVVYTDATTGKALYADNANPASIRSLLGVTTTSATIDNNINVTTIGEITDASWNWNMAGNVSLFLGTNGAITQGENLSGGAIICRIGYAITSTKIFVRIGEPIITA